MTFTPFAPAERRTRRMRRHLPGRGRDRQAEIWAHYITAGTVSPQEIAEWQQSWDELMADPAHRHQIRMLPPGPRTPPRPSQRRTRRMRDHTKRLRDA